MDIAELILGYIKVAIWPAVVVWALIVFRTPIRALVGRLGSLKAAGVEATFERATEDAAEVVGSGPESTAQPDRHMEFDVSDIVTVRATTYNDARMIGGAFRDGHVVMMDLSDTADETAKRLVDFAAGLIFHGSGSIERMSSRFFVLIPENAQTPPQPPPAPVRVRA